MSDLARALISPLSRFSASSHGLYFIMEALKLIAKLAISAGTVYLVSEVVIRHSRPWIGAMLASLPLLSVLTFFWIYYGVDDSPERTEKLSQHSTGVFFWVLPSLPMFLIFPYLLRRGLAFWPTIIICCLITMALYALLAMILKYFFGIEF